MRCRRQQVVTQTVVPFPAHRQHSNLVVLDRFRSSEPINTDVFEVLGQRSRAPSELPLGNDKEENSTRHDPASSMPEKDNFHTLIAGLTHLEVVRRIQIQEGKTVHAALHFKRVAMHHFNIKLSGLLCTVRIEFDAVRKGRRTIEDGLKCRAISNTWIERGKRFAGTIKMTSEPLCLCLGQGIKAKLQSTGISHGFLRGQP